MVRTTSVVNQAVEIVNPQIDPQAQEHDAPIQWIKVGGGSVRLKIKGKDKIAKQGEKFYARPSEIPKNFRDVIKPTNVAIPVAGETPVVDKPVPGAKPQYKMEVSTKRVVKPRGQSRAIFDVWEGEVKINDAALPKAEAEALLGFDIINPQGKVMNEKPLDKEKAEKVLANLNQ